jgi:hypothetical protein
LPWLSTLLKSLKVGGMEFNFRELQAQIQENREVIQATASALVSVGKDPLQAAAASAAADSAFSHATPAASDDDDATLYSKSAPDRRASGPPMADSRAVASRDAHTGDDTGDPNFKLFGNNPVAGGRRLSATVKPFPGSSDWFMIHGTVNSTDPARPLQDGTKVTFHLHPTFKPSVVSVDTADGAAVIDRVAGGWFTVGVEVDGVRLGLPLNMVPGAPERFKSR